MSEHQSTIFKTVQSESLLNKALSSGLRVESVSLGKAHCLAIISVERQKKLFVWGDNRDYQLGLPREVTKEEKGFYKVIPENVEIEPILCVDIAAKDGMSFVLGEKKLEEGPEEWDVNNFDYEGESCLECGREYILTDTERELEIRRSGKLGFLIYDG